MNDDRLETLVAESRQLRKEPVDAEGAGWSRLAQAAARPPRPFSDRLLVPALALSLAALAVALWMRRPPAAGVAAPPTQIAALPSGADWAQVELGERGSVGQLRQRRGSRVAVTPSVAGSAPRIALASGEICAQVIHRPPELEPPLLVEAPGLTVAVIGTHFCVRSDASATAVSVQEGRVRVTFTDGHQVSVGAGEQVSAPVPTAAVAPVLVPNAPAAPLSGPPVSPSSSAPSSIGRQNALFGKASAAEAQGDVTGALDFLREYQRTFPEGVFAPEAAVKLRRLTGAVTGAATEPPLSR